jgi:hypothetical protein
MTASIAAVGLTLALHSFGLGHAPAEYRSSYILRQQRGASHIVPPGPGDGWGFPNNNPDRFGWVNYGTYLPLGADRTAEYYFPRYHAVPPQQMFLQTYYNAFETRGQRYIPYAAAGGEHPMGGAPLASAELPVSPYAALNESAPVVPVPRLNGRVEAPPLPSGGSGLTP